MASTNQINKVVESIVVFGGDLIILNLCLSLLLFLWKKAFINLPFSCTVSFMMASLTLLLSGLFRSWEGFGTVGDSCRSARITCVEEHYSLFYLLGMYYDF